MINATEKAWLAWAREVIRTNGTQNRCRVCKNEATTAFERVLWPGYIGENYRVGGMLLVGAVHNREEFETKPISRLAAFAERWARGSERHPDDEYLRMLRAAYLESATKPISKTGRSWTDGTVWRAFDALRKDAGLQWSDVAFTNWSKCASPTQSVNAVRNRLYREHIWDDVPVLQRLPIKELRPGAVFVICGDAKVVSAIRKSKLNVPIVRVFVQYGYKSKFPDERRWHEWLPDDIAEFRSHSRMRKR